MTFARQGPTGGWVDNTTVITATQQNGIDVNQSRAVDGTAGGDYTPTGKVRFGGANGLEVYGTGAASRYQLASRSITRVNKSAWQFLAGDWAETVTTSAGLPTNLTLVNLVAGGRVWCPLDIPNYNTLDSVVLTVRGAQGHAAFPGGAPAGTVPTLYVLRTIDTGAVGTILGSTTDSFAVQATYEAIHTLTVSGLAATIDQTQYKYWAVFLPESGAGSVADATNGTRIYNLKWTCSVTSMDEA